MSVKDNKFILWEDTINIEDWKDGWIEKCEDDFGVERINLNEITVKEFLEKYDSDDLDVQKELAELIEDDDKLYSWAEELNQEYLEDDFINLSSIKTNNLISLVSFGRWDGSYNGICNIKRFEDITKLINNNGFDGIISCVYVDLDTMELTIRNPHHDATNYYEIRELDGILELDDFGDNWEEVYANYLAHTKPLGRKILEYYGKTDLLKETDKKEKDAFER